MKLITIQLTDCEFEQLEGSLKPTSLRSVHEANIRFLQILDRKVVRSSRPKSNSSKCSEGRIKHPGLIADAEALNVTYQHLFKVLEGQRESKSLLARYKALKAAQKSNAAKK